MVNIVDKVVELSGAPGSFDSNATDFDLLRDALLTAGLADALNDPAANLTVFAPNDAAFVGLANTLGYQGLAESGAFGYIVDALTLLGGGDPIPLLQSVLTYHVTLGEFFLADVASLGNGAMIPTLQGGQLTINPDAPGLGDLDPALPDPNLIGFDVDVDNGVIHVLDGVLLPLAVSAILSQPGTDFLIGDDGRDYFSTRDGNDFVDGNGGRDFIRTGSGNDVAIGGTGNDWIVAGRGEDIILGEEGHDKIFAGRGNDTIDGGSGNDWMSGGWGQDTFVFENGSGHDKIIGFRNGRDKIDLSGYDGIEEFADIKGDISGGWFGSKIELLGDDGITLVGTPAYQLDENDFLFA